MTCFSTACFLPKAYAGNPPCITSLGKETCFRIWFSNLASKCKYDKDFALWADESIDKPGENPILNYKIKSYLMVHGYNKGVCRNFAFCVSCELNSWRIKNFLLILPEYMGKSHHMVNLYVSPVSGKLMVADLTLQIDYEDDPDFDSKQSIFSAIPLERYMYLFYKSVNYDNVFVMHNNGRYVVKIKEFLNMINH